MKLIWLMLLLAAVGVSAQVPPPRESHMEPGRTHAEAVDARKPTLETFKITSEVRCGATHLEVWFEDDMLVAIHQKQASRMSERYRDFYFKDGEFQHFVYRGSHPLSPTAAITAAHIEVTRTSDGEFLGLEWRNAERQVVEPFFIEMLIAGWEDLSRLAIEARSDSTLRHRTFRVRLTAHDNH